jgi:ABC-type transporter Mla MlaB component
MKLFGCGMMWNDVDNWNNITNSQNRVRKKSFGGTVCFSNCHIIRLDTGGLVFLVSVFRHPKQSTTVSVGTVLT